MPYILPAENPQAAGYLRWAYSYTTGQVQKINITNFTDETTHVAGDLW